MPAVGWQNDETLNWLLEPESPGVRYLALRDLLHYPVEHAELAAARKAAHECGPIHTILENMTDPGYWSAPGPGYLPKYWSTVWSIITLAQLGASAREDKRIDKACGYILDHALTKYGQFSMSGQPSGAIDCLQGNLCGALVDLGCDDPRLDLAFDWMAHSVTGDGIAPMSDHTADIRYYTGKCGPLFACGANNKMACAWGGVKVMLAFSKWPESRRTQMITKAIAQGAEFLLHGDPAKAGYPNGFSSKPSQNWWKFGFPVMYVTDMLQNIEALVGSGFRDDPRITQALKIIQEKRDPQGRWSLEYDYSGKMWVDFGPKKQTNKWVTLRAMRLLNAPA